MAVQNQVSSQPLSISTTAVLSVSNFNQQVVCTGGSAYSVTLPNASGNANRFIDFNILTTSYALVTITPATGTIQGQTTFILGTGESCRVYCDGTNWWIQNLVLMPIYASISLSTNTAGLSTGFIPFDSVQVDLGSFYNASTHIYTPLYPGKYKVNARLTVLLGSIQHGQLNIFMVSSALGSSGGRPFYQPISFPLIGSNNMFSLSTIDICIFNGITDTCKFGMNINGSDILQGNSGSTYLCTVEYKRISNI